MDEVGRGPLAGPVTVGGVFCCPLFWDDRPDWYDQVTDSKLLSPQHRDALSSSLLEHPYIISALASSSAQYIDRYGIVSAIRRASIQVLTSLHGQIQKKIPDWDGDVVLDGKTDYGLCQYYDGSLTTLVQGDRLVWQIGAASILAKVHRDRYMVDCAKKKQFSVYGFDRHKGYGTLVHRKAIQRYGFCSLHRKTFCSRFMSS